MSTKNKNSKLPAQPKAPVTPPVAIGEAAPEDTAPATDKAPESDDGAEGDAETASILGGGTAPAEGGQAPAEGEKKKDGRGRPKNMIFTFTGAIGALLAAAPELKGMTHILSQKRERTEKEKADYIMARLAGGGALDAEFLAGVTHEEIGDKRKLSAQITEKNTEIGMLEKYGEKFEVSITRGAVNKYFEDKLSGVLHRLTKAVSPETPVAPGEAPKDENLSGENTPAE